MDYSAIVYYSKGENELQRILNTLREYNANSKKLVLANFKKNLDNRFIDKLQEPFDDSYDTLVNGMVEKAECLLFNEEISLEDLDLPMSAALYWIFSTLYFELKNAPITDYTIVPCFTGVSLGVFWAFSMTCRGEHFSDKECILIAYEYGKVLAKLQKIGESSSDTFKLVAYFSRKYFSNYYTSPIHAFGPQVNFVELNQISTPRFITTGACDTLVGVIAESFFYNPTRNTLKKKLDVMLAKYAFYEVVEF